MSAKKSQPAARRSRAVDPFAERAVLPRHLAQLAHAAPSATPRPAIKTQLLARIRAAQTPSVGAPSAAPLAPGWRFESANDAVGWFALPVPGVRLKELSVDPRRDVAQFLVEIAPGARFPDHEHTVGDEGMVLSGDVFTGGRLLRAGDFYSAGAGTNHTNIVSPSGCTAIVSTTATAWRRWRAEIAAATI